MSQFAIFALETVLNENIKDLFSQPPALIPEQHCLRKKERERKIVAQRKSQGGVTGAELNNFLLVPASIAL